MGIHLLPAAAAREPEFTDVRGISAMTGFSEMGIRAQMNKKTGIPFRKVGGKIVFNVAEVRAWLNAQPAFNLPIAK